MTEHLPVDTAPDIASLLDRALAARAELFEPGHQNAFRLFNGHLEGCPSLVVDLFATTLLIQNVDRDPQLGAPFAETAASFYKAALPWLGSFVLKTRHSPLVSEKRGRLLFGGVPSKKVLEYGTWYALDLRLNQDPSLYLDTRLLRLWLKEHLRARTLLNTFAYTGSYGVAALAGGASRVVQLDLNPRFMEVARESCRLNGLALEGHELMVSDFWNGIARLKRQGERFDCVVLDPPLLSDTRRGRFNLNSDTPRLINKVRPLVNDGGKVIAVNNALFLGGQEYMDSLQALCQDGYMQIEEIIPVPQDITGYPSTQMGSTVTDSAPFNYPTKIAILEVKRKNSEIDY